MRTISLCSGIGGLELGLPFTDVKVFSEINKLSSIVLKQNFPDIPNHGDFTQWESFDVYKPELIMGGLPCQPVSALSYHNPHYDHPKGDQNDKWLYDAFIEKLKKGKKRPVIFFENVPNIINFKELYRIIDELEDLDYTVRTTIVPASKVGAPHPRKRWFLLAWINRPKELQMEINPQPEGNALLHTLDTRAFNINEQPTPGTIRDKTIMKMRSLVSEKSNSIYYPSLMHWKDVIGIDVPDSIITENGTYSSEFKEWMMGFPPRWISFMELSPNASSMMTGNSVVPLQVRYAWDLILKEHRIFNEMLDSFSPSV